MNIEALEVKEISRTMSGEKIVEALQVTFDSSSVSDYIEKFNFLKDKGIIHKGEFSNDKWTMIHITDNDIKRYVNFEFNMEIDSEVILVIKCFIVIKLYYEECGIYHAQSSKRYIEQAILSTNYFEYDCINYEEAKVFNMGDNHKALYCYAILNFLKFYPYIRNHEFYCMYNKISSFKFKSNPRRLPNYSSIILFDYIIEDFFSYCSKNEKKQFLILYIWWKLTKIIPMRTIEFTILRRDCVGYSEQDNRYLIEIERVKNVVNRIKSKSIEILREIEINKEIFDLISEYKFYTKEQNKKKYLWSYKSYHKFSKRKTAKKNKYNLDYLSQGQLYKILDDFYIDIIEKKYGYKVIRKEEFKKEKELILTCNSDEIIMLDIGDTRHFAFCSLMLQGLNPLTIAQIGGHHRLKSQNHYHSHLETFIDSNVLETAKFLLHRQKFNLEKEHIVSDGKELIIRNINRDNTFKPIYMYKGKRQRIDAWKSNLIIDKINPVESFLVFYWMIFTV